MPFARALLAVLTLMPYVSHGQPTDAPAAGAVFAVGYVETQAKAADAGRAALSRATGKPSSDSPAASGSIYSSKRIGPGTSP